MADRAIISPERNEALVNSEGYPTHRLHDWLDDITNRLNEGQNLPTIEGSGNPEGVVTAVKDRLYRDTVGSLFYRKTTATGNTGWLVT